MASSKVMPSSTSRNSDLKRRRSSSSLSTKPSSSISDLQRTNNNNLASSMTVDGLIRNVYGGPDHSSSAAAETTLIDAEITLLDAAGAVTAISDTEPNGAAIRRQESNTSAAPAATRRTVDDVWREIVAGRRECKKEAPDEMMTLEDFLAKTGAAEEEEEGEVKVEPVGLHPERLSGGIYSFDSVPLSSYPSQQSVDGVLGFRNGVEVVGGERGKRRAVLEPLDKAAQQRQRRMIKNRESAARSRERKQAYQVELESLAVKLEEENEKLLREKAERTRERFKQLMEKVVPVVEKRKPRRVLRRVHSMHW